MTRSDDETTPVVLIVDDERPNRVLVRAYLESTCVLHEAVDGASALEALRRHPIDLVLLDVMMPEMNGFDVCRLIKQAEQYLPVILLTALGRQEDRITGLQAGADDFLCKPVNRHELRLRVQTFIKLKRQDEHIRRQLRELTARDQLIERQFTELRTLDSFKDELVSLLVHDLRNPLAGITGFLQVMQESSDDTAIREDARQALQASGLLRETLDDILHVRMLESGSVRLHCESVEADALVRDAIVSVEGAARARHVQISAVVDLSDHHVTVDRKLVRRAIENLLSNALKYSPSGQVVEAAVRSSGSDVEIEVADRGAGVPDRVKDQLFAKFGSVEAAQGHARRGVGLGLYMVRLVANAHGGRAAVRDRDGGGTAFGLYLPR